MKVVQEAEDMQRKVERVQLRMQSYGDIDSKEVSSMYPSAAKLHNHLITAIGNTLHQIDQSATISITAHHPTITNIS